ncbi:hypothetical protein [Lysobacter enzymogenes]|uniref:hypothetical protein n=1 Tax=Lysobacter enzymogenes TaxID=69 RepID=UPI00099B6B0C|nr:hypothetical protein [Lysobacter enzymogenes]UZW62830.1 hypothetical protein BV903_011265 [Lysobacter enzymogenes]
MSLRPPKSPPPGPAAPPFNPLWLLAGLAFPSLAAITALALAPRFEAAYAGLGAELPALTRLVFDYAWAPWLLDVAVLALWLAAPQAQRDRWAGRFGVVAGLAAIALLVVALYLPFFGRAAAL